MAFCTNCGAELPDGAKFCTECGTRVAPAPENPPELTQDSLPTPDTAPAPDAVPAAEPETQPIPKPEPQPEQPAAPVSPVLGNYAAPNVNAGQPGLTFRNVGKKKNTGLIVGIVALCAVLVIALLFVAGKLVSGLTVVPDDPDGILGTYEGIHCYTGNDDFGADDEWIRLQAGGKLRARLIDTTYRGSWTLNGESLVLNFEDDTFYGTLKDGVVTVQYYGLTYVFSRDGVDVPIDDSLTSPTNYNAAGVDLSWWQGDWYGWWIMRDGTGNWADEDDGSLRFWDTCARIYTFSDGTGYLELWDEDTEEGSCFASASLTFQPGSTAPGILISTGGIFWTNDLDEGEWYVDSSDTPMGSTIDHVICLHGSFTDENGDSFNYEIYLRPWGMEWEDVRALDTTALPYSNMMPGYYDSWYLPLIKDGVTVAPDKVGP